MQGITSPSVLLFIFFPLVEAVVSNRESEVHAAAQGLRTKVCLHEMPVTGYPIVGRQ